MNCTDRALPADNVVFEFVKCAQQHGIDIFRVFDSLNSMENLALGIKAIHAAGAVVEACICYTGDVSDSTKTKYTTEYYLDLVRQLVELDIHVLAIKDMAGLLKPKYLSLVLPFCCDDLIVSQSGPHSRRSYQERIPLAAYPCAHT